MADLGHRAMVEGLVRRGIRDPAVLAAMEKVPREQFVAANLAGAAYADRPLALSQGQTISQPFIVALMLEALRVRRGDRALEIGTGSGYSAAVLAELGPHVDTIERIPELAASARDRLAALGYRTVTVHEGDGTLGWPAGAPYDAIVVTACGPRVPPALIAQLAPTGRLVMPIGVESQQRLVRVTGDHTEDLGEVMFVPLIGEQAWPA